MRRVLFILIIPVIASLACSLSGDAGEPTAALIATSSPSPSPTTNLTTTPISQLNATPTHSSFTQPTSVAPATVTNCTPRTDWRIYTVQAGDTLGVIADTVGSTVQTLAAGNCLANPDSIFVGQQIRVPGTSSGTTGGSTSGTTGSSTSGSGTTGGSTSGGSTSGTAGGNSSRAPVLSSSLTLRPAVQASDGGLVTLQPTIALDIGVVADADTVRYYAGVSASDTRPVNIATDIDPFDGTRVEYTFGFEEKLYFWAVAENEFGATTSGKIGLTYDPSYDAGNGSNADVSISPYIGFDGSLYTLTSNATVTITWAGAPTNATRIEFYLAPGGTGSIPALISTDTNPTDGASISWTVPKGVLGHVSATAFFSDGRTQDTAQMMVYSE